jgi:hypothetical protein
MTPSYADIGMRQGEEGISSDPPADGGEKAQQMGGTISDSGECELRRPFNGHRGTSLVGAWLDGSSESGDVFCR